VSNYKNMLIEKENSIKRLTRFLYGVGILALAAIIGWQFPPLVGSPAKYGVQFWILYFPTT